MDVVCKVGYALNAKKLRKGSVEKNLNKTSAH